MFFHNIEIFTTNCVVSKPPGPPNITSDTRSVTGVQGESLQLPCQAKGYPPPVITWYKTGNRIPYDRRHHLSNGTLVIKNVQKSDSGKYICKAVNSKGKRDSVSVYVSVVGMSSSRSSHDETAI